MSAKYILIARELEQLLSRSGSRKLPTEAELCQRFGCSRQTVRAALAVLTEKGLIVRRQGSGSYPKGALSPGSREIALILADREEYTSPSMIRDIRRAAEAEGYTVSCLETGGSRRKERAHLAALLQAPPAGIILEPITDLLGCFHEDLLAALRTAGIPIVCVNGQYPEIPLAAAVDDAGAASMLTAELVGKGHREIAAILKSDDSRGVRRFRGVRKAAEELGAAFRDENCLWYSEQERRRLLDGDDSLIRRFLQEYRKNCSAVICFNDEIAFRLARAASREKQPLLCAGFDNSYLALPQQAGFISAGVTGTSPGCAAVQLLLHPELRPQGGCLELPMAPGPHNA